MSFKPLKKIILAAAVTLSCAFNTVAKAQAANPAPTEQTSSADSVHKEFNDKGVLISVVRYRNGHLNDGLNGEPCYQEFNDKGTLIVVRRFKDGGANDGANGEPAYQLFNDDGKLIVVQRFKDGSTNDGPNGEPAYQQLNAKGEPVVVMRFKNGNANDGPNGEPAQLVFENGTLSFEVHYKDGKWNDGVNGEPAYLMFNDKGKLIAATRYSNGAAVKTLSTEEMAAYQKQRDAALKKETPLRHQNILKRIFHHH
jgi:antitoxin component YwqK of YwqJK toxin-antitoxin module